MLPQEGAYLKNHCHWETKYREVFPKCHSQSKIYHNYIPPEGLRLKYMHINGLINSYLN